MVSFVGDAAPCYVQARTVPQRAGWHNPYAAAFCRARDSATPRQSAAARSSSEHGGNAARTLAAAARMNSGDAGTTGVLRRAAAISSAILPASSFDARLRRPNSAASNAGAIGLCGATGAFRCAATTDRRRAASPNPTRPSAWHTGHPWREPRRRRADRPQSTATTYWLSQRAVDRPTCHQYPIPQGAGRHVQPLRPVFQKHCLATERQMNAVALVFALLFGTGPSTVDG